MPKILKVLFLDKEADLKNETYVLNLSSMLSPVEIYCLKILKA